VMLTADGEPKLADFGLAYLTRRTALRTGEKRTPQLEELEEQFPTLRGTENVKEATFAFPRQLMQHKDVYTSQKDSGASGCGTPGYLSPERLLWKKQQWQESSLSGSVEQPGRPGDVWAVGVIMLDLVLQALGHKSATYQFLKIPVTFRRSRSWYSTELRGWLEMLPDQRLLRETLRSMLAYDQNERLSAAMYRKQFARMEEVDVEKWKQKLAN